MAELVEQARARDGRTRSSGSPQIVPKEDVIALYTHAALFVCPSVYEPFGIINLEAMACETPVVASAVGGITEVVVPGETGLLVPFEPSGAATPSRADPEAFSRALADAVNGLMADPERRRGDGRAPRARVLAHFSWRASPRQTLEFYRELLGKD